MPDSNKVAIDEIVADDLQTLIRTTLVESVTYFASVDSSNTQAIAILQANQHLRTPHLVYAESQTAGRGRGSNPWWSSGGSLTFSLIVDAAGLGLPIDQQPLLPLITGMAILRACRGIRPSGRFALKWPNDVYLNDRKLAGILIEVPASGLRQSGDRHWREYQ